MPAYFNRGSGHNSRALYSERGDDYANNLDRLARKFETARAHMPKPEVYVDPQAKVGLVAYGSSHWAILESRDQLREEAGVVASYLRVRAYPFTRDLLEFIDRHDRVYVVEQNRNRQMLQLMRTELSPERIAKLRSVRHYNGLPIDARSITDDLLAQEGVKVARKKTRGGGVAGESRGEWSMTD
jgi:2-oxoglutarate ferredoxin oxidoreductase subunit alpha